MSEERLGHLTGWIRRRPNSLEFWELVLTTDRLLWCFAGETYSSALLRADMGESTRDELAGLDPEAIAEYDDRNFAVPLDSLACLRLVRGTRFRRARLEVEWNGGERTLYSTKASDPQEELIDALSSEPALEGVAVEARAPASLFERS
ncbi:hypothetical protein [Halalkalicoccus tibetensis]|uniref:Uncharacterized protein n=1 Tax=Halalkalicoccus tibetensis TaxID=175632 RepID=A0ABD5VBR4_9EURY